MAPHIYSILNKYSIYRYLLLEAVRLWQLLEAVSVWHLEAVTGTLEHIILEIVMTQCPCPQQMAHINSLMVI